MRIFYIGGIIWFPYLFSASYKSDSNIISVFAKTMANLLICKLTSGKKNMLK